MNNPAFIIDGYTEKKILQELCPGQPIRRTDLNGKDASLSAIAKRIASLIRLLGNRHYPIVILLDKEARKISFDTMAQQIRTALEAEGITDQDLRIGVADRMLENWIIADWLTIADRKKRPPSTESINGAATIKKIKGTYDKTTDGVEFFISARQKQVYKNSPSFRHFINQLDGIFCDYLDFRK